MSDPNNWNPEGDSIGVGDPMTEEWLDRFRSLMTAYNESQRDALRYRRLRALADWGDFWICHQPNDNVEVQEIDYASELDEALDDPDYVKKADSIFRLGGPTSKPPSEDCSQK